MRERDPREAEAGQADGDVVSAVLAGDREAYRVLVRRYQDLLYRHAARLTGNEDVAADMVQAAFTRAYENLRRCRQPDRFGAWVFRILANGCKDHLKSRRRRDTSLDDAGAQAPVAGTDPERELERSELRGLLTEALDRLPDPQREAFVLKHVEGRSYEEIAEYLDVSIPALKMRVHRAREALRGVLEEVL